MAVTDDQIAEFGAAARQSRQREDAALIELGRRASREAHRGISFERKVRLCAGDPGNEDGQAMAKALDQAADALSGFRNAPRAHGQNRHGTAAPLGTSRPRQASPHSGTLKPAPATAAPAARAWAFRRGDTAQFKHGMVHGEGKIVESGKVGITVLDSEGRHHQVRHEYVLPRPPGPAFIGPSQAEHVGGRHAAEALAFYDFRDRIAGDIRSKRVTAATAAIMQHAVTAYGLNQSDAAEWTERFIASINRDLEHRTT